MTFEVTILGNGSATPTLRHNPSAQVVNLHDKLFLVDCGEGTQLQMRKYEIKFQRINHIFISHLHGDHYLGLVGYISTMNLLGRQRELNVYGPVDLKEIVDAHLRFSQSFLDFEIRYHPLEYEGMQLLFEDRSLEVFSFPLKHRIPCCGFLFREKRPPRKIIKSAIERYKLQPSQIIKLKKEQPVELKNGEMIQPDDVLEKQLVPRSFAYCSDTMYWEHLVPSIEHANLLYHESTFLEEEKDRAKSTFHSTAAQAAQIAAAGKVGQLLLGHFSSRYHQLEPFVEEARQHFRNTFVSVEGMTYPVH